MSKTKLSALISTLETLAPRAYQEDYDNSGLIVGDPDWDVQGVLVSLDCLESVIDEALSKSCNVIVSHHPIVFKGLKRISGRHYVERAVLKAIKNDIALYAIHTNLDNVYTGVNAKICEKIGLINPKVLQPKKDTLAKLTVFCPKEATEQVLKALHEAGAGNLGNYKHCSFSVEGTGAFMPNDLAKPHVGQKNLLEKVVENRIEVIFPRYLEEKIVTALRKAHPYEEVAYYLHYIANANQELGSGMIAELAEPLSGVAFLELLKHKMGLKCIRHTQILDKSIKKVAVCGGAGSFLLPAALKAGVDAFVSADFKYHEFFEADGKLLIADIGHYESEIFTTELLSAYLKENFSTFAVNFSEQVTNPVSYLT